MGFEPGFLELKAGVLPIELPLLVGKKAGLANKSISDSHTYSSLIR